MPQTHSPLPGYLLAIAAVAAWGLYIVTEWLYTQGLGPFAVLTLRTFLAYAVLLLLSHKQLLADGLLDEAKFALLGVACIPFYYGLENLALQQTNAGTVRPSWPRRPSSPGSSSLRFTTSSAFTG